MARGGHVTQVAGWLVVLGGGGVFLEVADHYPVGALLGLRFKIASSAEEAVCRGIVRDGLEDRGVAVEFLDISPMDRDRVTAFVQHAVAHKGLSPESTTMTKHVRILLAEDDPILRHLLDRVLTQEGFRVTETRDGAEALAVVHQDAPAFDLLLTDVIMPHKDGFTLAEELRALAPQTKVLFVSGHAEDTPRVRVGLQQCGCRFLLKPFTKEQLVATLRELLDTDGNGGAQQSPGVRTVGAERHASKLLQFRAPRLPDVVPLLYRLLDQDGRRAWQRGLTMNISRTGLLLEATGPLPVEAMLALTLDPPLALADELGTGEVHILAEVVRHGMPTADVPFPVAVRFLSVDRHVIGTKGDHREHTSPGL